MANRRKVASLSEGELGNDDRLGRIG